MIRRRGKRPKAQVSRHSKLVPFGYSDVGCALAAPRSFTGTELRGKRSTYAHRREARIKCDSLPRAVQQFVRQRTPTIHFAQRFHDRTRIYTDGAGLDVFVSEVTNKTVDV